MPIIQSYTCEICGLPVNDSDLIADAAGTLRRLEISGSVTRPVAGNPVTVDLQNIPTVVFCGMPHLLQWLGDQEPLRSVQIQ